MAGPYYWVGGTGNWSDATNHWATSSGGSPNVANVPGTSDDIYFDDNSFSASDQYVTVNATANCRDMIWGYNITNWNATLKGSSVLNIYGSLLFDASMAAITYSGTLTFRATSTGKTINTRSHDLVCTITFDGFGGGWTLTDNLYMQTKNLTLTRGGFSTDGYSVKCLSFDSSNTNTRSLTLAESIIVCYDTWNLGTVTGLTFSGASSSISVGYGDIDNPDFAGGGKTYGEVICYSNRPYSVNQYVTITGNNTIATLSFPIAGTSCRLQSTTQTVTNLTVAGTEVLGICIVSGTISTSSTIALDHVLFKSVTKSGTGSITVDSGQDLGGNSNITFNNSLDYTKSYWVGGTGTFTQSGYAASDSDHWSIESGGTGGAKKPCSSAIFYSIDAIFDANSFSAGGQTVTFAAYLTLATFDAINATNSPIFSGSVALTIYGNLYLPVNCTWPTNALTFASASGTKYITSNGHAHGAVEFNGSGGTFVLSDAFTINSLTITAGELLGNTQTITTIGTITVTSAAAAKFNFTACTINCRTFSIGASSVITATNSIITCYQVDGSITFGGGGKTYGTVDLQPGTIATISGNNTFSELRFSRIGKTYRGTASSIQTVTSFVAVGALGSLITIQSTSTTKWTLTKTSGTVYALYCSIVNCWASGGATFNAIQSTNGGNTTGWNFVKGASTGKTPTLYISGTYEVPIETYDLSSIALADIKHYILEPEVLLHDPIQVKSGSISFCDDNPHHYINSMLTFDENGLMLATFSGTVAPYLYLYRSVDTNYDSFEDFGIPDLSGHSHLGARGVSVDENNDYIIAAASNQAHNLSKYSNGAWSAHDQIYSTSYGVSASIQAGIDGISYHGIVYFNTSYGTLSYKCTDGTFTASKTIGYNSRSAAGVYDRETNTMYVFVATKGTNYKVSLYKSVNNGDTYTLVKDAIFPENATDYSHVVACIDEDGGLHVAVQPAISSIVTTPIKYRYSADGGATWGPTHEFDAFKLGGVAICAYEKHNVILMLIDKTTGYLTYYRNTVIGWLDYEVTDIAPSGMTISYKKGADGYFYFGYSGDSSHSGIRVNKLAFLVEYTTDDMVGNTGKVNGSSYELISTGITVTVPPMVADAAKAIVPTVAILNENILVPPMVANTAKTVVPTVTLIDIVTITIPPMIAKMAKVVVPISHPTEEITVPVMVAKTARAVIPSAHLVSLIEVPPMVALDAKAVIPTPVSVDIGLMVQVYDITNDNYFDLTVYDQNGDPVSEVVTDFYVFVPGSSWLDSDYSISFDADSHPTCTQLAIKYTNRGADTVYIDNVMLTPDYTGKWPQMYKDGPKSESKLTVYKCTLIANGYIASNSVILSVGLNSYPITRNGDEITLGTNYTEFNDNNGLNFYLNGILLEKAVDCIYVSNLSFYLVTALDSTDVITIIKGGN